MKRLSRICSAAFLALALSLSRASAEILPPGFRPLPVGVDALTSAKIVVQPGDVLPSGTIVIRDGFIESVGTNVSIPPDARVWDMKGTTIYAGFIEPYLVLNATNAPISTSDTVPVGERSFTSGGVKFYGAPGVKTDMGQPGPGYEVGKITPEFRALDKYTPSDKELGPLRELGFTAAVIAPAKGIIRGSSALVALTDQNPNRAVIKTDVFQHIAFEADGGDDAVYPSSLMGVIAAIRQSFFDAQHYAADWADYQKNTKRRRPEFDPSLAALAPVMQRKMPVMFEPGSALMDSRATHVAQELGFDFCIVSCGQEWRRPDVAKQAHATFIVPLNFPSLPKLPSEDDWQQVSLDQLRAWDWAPENPALLRKEGLEIALTTYGLSDKKSFRDKLRLALDRGLSEQDAVAALTTVPAKLCGVEDQLGTIAVGKIANLLVVKGESYFDEDAKVRAVWIDGRIYPASSEEPKAGGKAEETKDGSTPLPSAQTVKEEPEKHPTVPPIAQSATNTASVTNMASVAEKKPEDKDKKKQLHELQKTRVARSPLDGRGAITEPKSILIQGATIWTCGPKGILTNASFTIVNGKIGQIGGPIAWGGAAVNCDGLVITPGIVDCHSHSAILGDVNEGTLPSTAMCRIADVVNSESDNLYQQLAGGVTVINLLHGSANPIGGQNCVIKLRDGDSPDELIYSNAPPGIKFALGENVKQSNWGEKFTTRFPQTRMGVRTFYENRFTAAQEYQSEWERYRNGKGGAVPPRRDLEMDALVEILQGKRLIHCHAYRQDEMLMLERTMQSFGVRIGTFQHVLEGYKIADELAAGGIGGSTFSDWWAYKFEVYDAIPFNGSLMRERGVTVSFNSDSSDLARRLYLEAAKAVKYGGTPETEALKFVTLNPARQLHIDKWVGSLEPGKDADFAVWSKSPLDSGTVCLQTWIDGKKYFDRALTGDRTAQLNKEREDLLAKAKKIAKLADGGGEQDEKDAEDFFRVSLEHEFDGRERHCDDK